MFGVSTNSVARLWKKYKREGLENALSSSREKCGRKKIDIDINELKSIPFKKKEEQLDRQPSMSRFLNQLCTQFGDFLRLFEAEPERKDEAEPERKCRVKGLSLN